MKITDLKPQTKNKNKCNVFVDNQYRFALFLSDVIDLNIKIGREIEEKELKEIEQVILRKNAFNDSFKLLSLMDYSKKSLKEKLLRKEYPSYLIDEVILYLEENNYIDDYEYAKKYIRYLSGKKKGKNLIISELIKKGIYSDIYEELLKSEYEPHGICDLAKKKLASSIEKEGSLNYKVIGKTKEYLLRRGFSYDEVNKAVDYAIKEI